MNSARRLMRWANGTNSYTELARASHWAVTSSEGVGLSDPVVDWLWGFAKNDAELACRAVAGCRNPEMLAKMSKDRRVSVKIEVAKNPNLAVLDLVAFAKKAAAARNRNWNLNDTLQRALKDRVARMNIDEAIALLDEACYLPFAGEVAHHRAMTDAQMTALAGKICVGWDRHGISGAHAKMTGMMAARHDLGRFSDEALKALAETGGWQRVAMAAVRENRRDLIDFIYVSAVADCDKVGRDTVAVLASAMLEDRHYQWMLSLNAPNVTGALAENLACNWALFADVPASAHTCDALGRAIAELFVDDPAVWLLMLEMVSDRRYTIGELVDLAKITFPQSLKDA